MRRIVVSGINIRKGGTLTILRDCLRYLSGEAQAGRAEVTALVHRRELCDYPGIDYIEMPDSIQGWLRRLRHEYITMHRISQEITERKGPIDLWLSLHDTTPRVEARRQAVYCQTSFPFMKIKARDFRMDPKIPIFALLTRFAYQINVGRNSRLIVQQRWLKEGLSRLLGVDRDKFIVAPPERAATMPGFTPRRFEIPTFLYVSTADCHKNFETLCRAAEMLEKKLGKGRFQVILTVGGTENRYARWLHQRWGHVESIRFEGLMDKPTLYGSYAGATCLVFMSRVETWGLPISEFMAFGKPMILADLPYAHETSAGSRQTAFTPVGDPKALAQLMNNVIDGRMGAFASVPSARQENTPTAHTWDEIFRQLTQ